MTETRRRRLGPAPVLLASLACFLVLFAALAIQLRNGRDPALGAAEGGSQKPKQVLVRRVVLRRVVVDEPRRTTAPVAGSGSAPGATAPAPVSTPAPAPAPAPVTRSS